MKKFLYKRKMYGFKGFDFKLFSKKICKESSIVKYLYENSLYLYFAYIIFEKSWLQKINS